MSVLFIYTPNFKIPRKLKPVGHFKLYVMIAPYYILLLVISCKIFGIVHVIEFIIRATLFSRVVSLLSPIYVDPR